MTEWKIMIDDATVLCPERYRNTEGIVSPIKYLKAGRLCVDSKRTTPSLSKDG